MPFMYFPKLLEGDTQPWIFAAALVALVSFRTEQFLSKKDVPVIVLVLACIVAYIYRVEETYALLRHFYTYVAFLVFWIVCRREKGEYFIYAVKLTVVVWFVVGLYQFVTTKLGYQIYIPGRFLPGRMGPPSLTAEASYYGSISMIHLMYMLSDKRKYATIYIVCALASVVLSGSLLAMTLLIFPLLKLPRKYSITIGLVICVMIIGDFYITSSGVASRLASIFENGVSVNGVLQDASLNLRAGHIYYTLVDNFFASLLLLSPTNYMDQYNAFARDTGILIETGSNFILPAVGEMIYSAGLPALMLFTYILYRAQKTCVDLKGRLIQVAFIIACMLNPITISNIFLVMYINKRD